MEVESNKNIDLTAEFLNEKQDISLIQNKPEKIYFSISNISNYSEEFVKLQNYSIPVFIFPEEIQQVKETPKFRFSPSEIDAIFLKKEAYSFKIFLVNLGRELSEIQISADVPEAEIEISPDYLPDLKSGAQELINITMSFDKKGNFSGAIIASSGNVTAEIPVSIRITENKSEIAFQNPVYEEKNCSESGGMICKTEEKCDSPLELTIDGYCCKGKCIAEKSSSGWIYGIIILLILAALVLFFLFYAKRKQKKAIDILKQREKNYQERMQGSEVKGSLGKS